MKKQHYMTRDERQQLEALYRNHIPVSDIARQLGFTRQTIYNELKRGSYSHLRMDLVYEQRYSADKAQKIHEYNQSAKGRPLKIGHDHAYAAFLEKKIISDRFSPAAALASARMAGFSTSICSATLYSYIDKKVFLELRNRHLLIKGRKRHTPRELPRIAHPKLPSIVNRPDWINDRSVVGHWEMDLVIGKKGSSACLLTLTERATRRELIFKLRDRRAATVCAVFDRLERKIPDFKDQFQSITTDNGSEFLRYEELQRSVFGGQRFELFYCHSFAAWEKGSNENHNRMIRRWFPKGTDFTRISQRQISDVQDWMNNYPRKILGWLTPNLAAA